MTRANVLAWIFIVLAVVGTAAVLFPVVRLALAALVACAGSLALLGAVCLVASRIDGRGKGGA